MAGAAGVPLSSCSSPARSPPGCSASTRATRASTPRASRRRTAALGDALLAPFARWDTTWFVAIAQDGYGDGAREAFFPLYPLLLAVGGTVTGGETVLAGIVLSTAFAAVALTVLHRLVALDYGATVARGAVLATAFMPMSFFLSAVYSESLFLMLSVGAVYAARTRPLGVGGRPRRPGGGDAQRGRRAARLPLVLLWWDARRARRGRDLARGWRSCPAGVGGLLPLPVGDRAATRRRRSRRRTSGSASSRARSWARGTARCAAWRRARASSCPGRASRCSSTQAGGDPFVVARHNIELFAWLVAGLAALALGLRQAAARVPRLRRRGARAAALVSGRARSRSCRCHASCSCCSRSPSPSQPGRRSGGGAGRCS